MPRIDFKQVFDFTGGLNLRADQFQLADNESPKMLNVETDPRGGVFSRAGYKKMHTEPVVTIGDPWNPKGLFDYRYASAPLIMLSTGFIDDGDIDGKVYHSSGGNYTKLQADAFNDIDVTSTNGASFTQWEDTLYIAIGSDSSYMYKWKSGDAYATQLLASGPTWQKYEVPVGGYMPRAELTLAHANKLFVANTQEMNDASPTPELKSYPNRLRWSHENSPENWFQEDYIDITAGGEGIRSIRVVDGQLLIFKPKAVYLLMGYDADSFQLVELTKVLGADYPQHTVEGSGGCYFFDYPNGLYFYDRNGIQDVFERIRPIIINREVNSLATDQITLSFVRERVWVSMPYKNMNEGTPPAFPSVNFIFDPSIGPRGAYTMFQTAKSFETEEELIGVAGYGLVSGCNWRDAQDIPHYIMTNPDDEYPYVMVVDDYNNIIDDVPTTEEYPFTGFFETTYRTTWFDDNRYVQLKSFIRPYFVLKEVPVNTEIRLGVYKNYDETNQAGGTRIISLTPVTSGSFYSTTGVGGVYGTATYGYSSVGSAIKRKGISPLGRGYAVQLEFRGPDDVTDVEVNPGRKWGMSSIAYKFKRRNIRGT